MQTCARATVYMEVRTCKQVSLKLSVYHLDLRVRKHCDKRTMIFIPKGAKGLCRPPIPLSVWMRVLLQSRTHSQGLEQKGFLTGNSVAHRTTGEGEQTRSRRCSQAGSGGPQGQEQSDRLRCWVTKQTVGGGMRWRRDRKGLGAEQVTPAGDCGHSSEASERRHALFLS